jgi:putative ABC transport system permease protein
MLDGLIGDARLAIRACRAAPTVTTAVILTLALGIGATTAVYSVANALVLRPLPVRSPSDLVTITSETALRHGFQAGTGWNHAMWTRLRQRADAFGGGFAWILQRLDLSEGGEMQPITALFASGELFSTLGVEPAIGRTFTVVDDVPGGGPDGAVAVIGYRLWQRRYAGSPDVLGSRLSIEGTPITIIGVAPESFRGVDVGQPFDVAMPFGTESIIRGDRSLIENERALLLTVMLRLKPGQTRSDAAAALSAMQPQILAPDAPQFLKEPFLISGASTGISDRSRLRQQYQFPLVVLSIISGIVLLIVCLNVANLLLVRAAARRRELGVRLALGASRWRIGRQYLLEALTLGSMGTVGGLLCAAWAARGLAAQLPLQDGSVALDLLFDWRVLIFTAAVATLAAVLFGTVPALHASRVPPIDGLRDGGRGDAGGGRMGLLPGGLVMVQVALSIVLVASAGLFVKTMNRLTNAPLGLEPDGLLVVSVNTNRSVSHPAGPTDLHQRLLDAVAAVPGVNRAAGSVWTPIGTGGGGLLTDARGRRAELGRQVVAFNFVTPGWFATYGTAIEHGRDFDARDGARAARVAVINEALRRSLLPDAEALGRTIHAGPCGDDGCTVVGLVADALYGHSLRESPPPTVYMSFAQSGGLVPPSGPPFRITIRAAGDPGALWPALAATLGRIDAGLTYTVRAVEEDLRASVAQERLLATLAGFFGAVALLLAAVGLYGVSSYAAGRRRAEIGIRLALGGQPYGVLRIILRRIVLFVVAGTVVGMLATLWLSRFVVALLYGVQPHDAATLLMTASTVVSVAVVAGWLPASRAVRMDPAQVLREP